MCGIAGLRLDNPRTFRNPAVLSRILDMLRHRGPDDSGEARSGPWHIGMVRLAIQDPAHGKQPMCSSDGRWLLVLNGEIYNFLDLRQELISSGVILKTRNDAEVLLELIAHRGVLQTLQVIEGMFAFAAVDRLTNEVWLCRDRFGEKPLFIDRRDGGLAFCSELTPLLEAMPASKTISTAALATIFRYGYPSPGLTAFQHINELRPGCWLRCTAAGEEYSGAYWQPPNSLDEGAGDLRRSGQKLLDLLEASVSKRLVADVPLGLFLSGGIDSAAVAQAAVSRRPDIEAVTVGFDVSGYDERPLARMTARHLGIKLHEEIAAVPSFSSDMVSDLLVHYGQPFADSSAVPMRAVSRIARKRFKVVLSGDGGDELLAGYPVFRRHRLFSCWGGGMPGRALSAWLAAMVPSSGTWETAKRVFTLNSSSADGLFAYASDGVFSDEQVMALFAAAPEAKAQLQVDREAARELWLNARDPMLALSLHQLRTSLPQDMLMKSDRMSMAESLEVRAPFLDSRLAAFCLALPTHLKLNGAISKFVLREALAGRVPRPVLEAPKHGFALPLRAWMAHEFWRELFREAHEYVRDSAAELDGKVLLRQVESDAQRCANTDSYRALHRAWLIYSYLRWRRRWFAPSTYSAQATGATGREVVSAEPAPSNTR